MSSTGFFGDTGPIPFEGPDSQSPLAYRHYDADELVQGKRMEDHLRAAVCYWHSFVWPGNDPFGGPTFERPWAGDDMAAARLKAEVAFELYDILGLPFFTFHDRDIAPEGGTLAESNRNVDEVADIFAGKMQSRKVRLLWGTANLFSHRRYMAGAATNPDPEIFAYAAAQVKHALDVTHRLGGANYVLWGGREGYETGLNTDIGREMDQMGRFLAMVVEYKHKIGFSGTILIEPKPQEPTKHQYDYDVATVYGFLKRYGLENEVKVNIEVGHAVLAGHSFEHEIATAAALGILGSVDANRNDYQSGWDTDQFPNNAAETALAMVHILKTGGLGTGGFNFDSKLRRQSIEPTDLIEAHIGGMDILARGLKAAATIIDDGELAGFVEHRYGGWKTGEGAAMLAGERNLEDVAARITDGDIEPHPVSGRQEALENLVSRFV
ncbi:Xylose isomerase [hydrothermal vent metagenome]|uniref:xylose isomerase n=1 Tax=hydrothermal vent metagenome TaxID=652676 RepID=A0A3B0THN5_9ZZZZ